MIPVRLRYLCFFFLVATVSLGRKQAIRHDVQDVLEHRPQGNSACKQQLTGPIETTQCDYETVEGVNENLYARLHDLVATPFFKYFRVDLFRDCPFWQENGFCMNRECGITSMDESEIPEKWRAAALSRVETPSDDIRNALTGCYYRDSDFCFLDDASDGEYLDLTQNPERFTGYTGPRANRVWSSIYDENCFGLSELSLLTSPSSADVSLSAEDLLGIHDDTAGHCVEKRVYYRIISGMHASISTHICYENMPDQTTGNWMPDLQCFVTRIATHPERLQNMYFNVVLMLRALSRLGPYLSAYDICSGDESIDNESKTMLKDVISIANQVGSFDESLLFRGENAKVLKQEFKEHFRNVSRIMDCVGCDKCRLWGKVQVTGIATALKILFELDDKTLAWETNPTLLQRSELVAFINTLHRFSESLHAVNYFREMWANLPQSEEQSLLKKVEENTQWKHPAQPSPSNRPGATPTRPSLASAKESWRLRLLGLYQACQRSTVDCVQTCARALSNIFTGLISRLVSSKAHGPRRQDL